MAEEQASKALAVLHDTSGKLVAAQEQLAEAQKEQQEKAKASVFATGGGGLQNLQQAVAHDEEGDELFEQRQRIVGKLSTKLQHSPELQTTLQMLSGRACGEVDDDDIDSDRDLPPGGAENSADAQVPNPDGSFPKVIQPPPGEPKTRAPAASAHRERTRPPVGSRASG